MANTIEDKLIYLEGTKSAIKDAIIAKGGEVSDTDTFRSYAQKIEDLPSGKTLNELGLTFAYSNIDPNIYPSIE